MCKLDGCCPLFCLGEALKPDNVGPPCMSMAFFKQLAQCWRWEQGSVSVSKSMHCSHKRNPWDSSKQPSLSLTWSPCQFSQKLWGLLFLAVGPWDEKHWVGLGSLSPQEVTSAARKCPHHQILTAMLWEEGLPFLHLRSFYQYQCGFFWISLIL